MFFFSIEDTSKHLIPETGSKPLSIRAEVTGILVKGKIDFDESKFLRIFKSLLKIRIFESKDSHTEQNFAESLREYELAINSENRYECFKHLFSSLEKMVNIKKDRHKEEFNNELIDLTNINIDDAVKFWECNNRMKHSSRKDDDVETLKKCEKELPNMIRLLKNAVDDVIFLRIKLFRLYVK
ncbi:MAG: hypothetical protein K8E24_015275 [Methanobacterium paludis]|nr:hypothetical protein [Methanobacterium paludis]